MGAAAYYLLFPQTFDPNLAALQKLYASTPAAAANPWALMLSLILQSALLAVPINALASIGEEFGWRAYLLQKLMARFAGAPVRPAPPVPLALRLARPPCWSAWSGEYGTGRCSFCP